MSAGTKCIIYMFVIAITVALSFESFFKYEKTQSRLWLIPTGLLAAAFVGISIHLFRWWAKVVRGEKA